MARPRRNKPTRRGIEPVGVVLGRDRLLHGLVDAPRSPVSPRDWELAVGSRIAARTRPDRLERGILFVVVGSAAWSQELSLLAQPIVASLRRVGVQVSELRFRVGKLEAPARPSRRPKKHAPPEAPLPEVVQRTLAVVEDEGLRDAISRAAKRSLGWGRG